MQASHLENSRPELDQWFSQCGPWREALALSGALFELRTMELHPQPVESESLRVEPSNLFYQMLPSLSGRTPKFENHWTRSSLKHLQRRIIMWSCDSATLIMETQSYWGKSLSWNVDAQFSGPVAFPAWGAGMLLRLPVWGRPHPFQLLSPTCGTRKQQAWCFLRRETLISPTVKMLSAKFPLLFNSFMEHLL